MYNVLPSFILGFHGCDEAVAERVFAGQDTLKPSENDYDWLGPGIYFWESNPARALEYATLLARSPRRSGRPHVIKPAVVGAVIDPGYCLNLLDSRNLQLVCDAYQQLKVASERAGTALPRNKTAGASKDLLLRHLDCAVIRFLHQFRESGLPESRGVLPFDTVRAVFVEGEPLYPGAGFHGKSHIQLCVRDTRRIKGYFRVIADPLD